jgi:hypothetical protein
LTPPLHDRSQPLSKSVSRIRIQRRPTASASAGGPLGRCSHWASRRTRNPAGDRSRHAKLSFTEQPDVAVSISARTASPDAVGSSVTASGYCGGGRRSAAETSARNPLAMPCRPQTMAHHSALLRAAARTRFSPRSPSITWTRIDHPLWQVQGYHGSTSRVDSWPAAACSSVVRHWSQRARTAISSPDPRCPEKEAQEYAVSSSGPAGCTSSASPGTRSRRG